MMNRPITVCLWFVVLVMALMALVGCGGIYKSSGKPAQAPDGYVQLCRDMPDYPTCKPLPN